MDPFFPPPPGVPPGTPPGAPPLPPLGALPGGMPGMPPMPPMGPPPGPDPMMALQAMADQIAERVIDAQEPIRKLLPWQRPPKPTAQQCGDLASLLQQENQYLLSRFADDLEWLHMTQAGTFRDGDDELDTAFQSSSLRDERDLVVALGATTNPSYRVRYVDDALRDDARKVQDTLYHWDRLAVERHAGAGNGDLAFDEWKLLTDYGRICGLLMLDLNDPEYPFDYRPLDPATVYGAWDGKRGLKYACVITRATARKVIGDWDQHGEVRRLLLGGQARNNRRVFDPLDDHHEGEVVEYFDRRWRCVLFDGRPVVPVVEHDYGFVPILYQLGNRGDPNFTSSPSTKARRLPNGTIVEAASFHEVDLVDKGVSLIHVAKARHRQEEAVMGLLLTAAQKSVNPPYWRYQTPEVRQSVGNPQTDSGPGGANPAILGQEQIQYIPTTPEPAVLGPLMQRLSLDHATGSLPLTMHGIADRSQTGGYAVGQYNEAGAVKMAPELKTMERYKEQLARMRLRMWYDFGHLAKYQDPTDPAPMMIPRRRQRPGEDPAFELTREVLERVGFRAEVSLKGIRQSDLPQFFNAMALGVDKGFATIRDTLYQMGHPDPDEALEDWLAEAAMKNPRFMEFFLIPKGLEDNAMPDWAAAWRQFVLATGPNAQPPPGAQPTPPPGQINSSPAAGRPATGQPSPPPGGEPPFGP